MVLHVKTETINVTSSFVFSSRTRRLNSSAVTAVNCFLMHYSAPLPLMEAAEDMNLPLRGPEVEGAPLDITITGGKGVGEAAGT